MAKKIFLLITSLFIVMVTIFYSNHFGLLKKEDTTKTTEEVTMTSTEKETKNNLPGDVNDWRLLLVNEDKEIKEEPKNLKELPNGYQVDERIYNDFSELMDGAKKDGIELTVISAFRSVEDQRTVLSSEIAMYESQGYKTEEATDLAMKYVTKPGHSEHHTGLALDVLEVNWYNDGNMLEEGFGDTEAGKWLAKNACHYGFVIRYQKGKEKLTGINYEPWHIRYVGKENAEYMTTNNIVLEEYLDQLKK